MAHVTEGFGMGSPALARTTAPIRRGRPTRNCEASERICTMAGVWAAAVAAASSPTQARMPVLLKACFFARRENRSLTVAALFAACIFILQDCPHESGHGRPEAR